MSFDEMMAMAFGDLVQLSMDGGGLSVDECALSRINEMPAEWGNLSPDQRQWFKKLCAKFEVPWLRAA